MVKCPVCQVEMSKRDFGGIETDVCEECGGVLLDEGELEDLTGLIPGTGREMECPDCGRVMNRRIFLDVEIDYCGTCGIVWLDPGEFGKITNHPSPRGGNLSLYNYARDRIRKT